MALPDSFEDREYKRFKTDSNGDTAVNIVGEVSIVSGGSSGTKWRLPYIGTTVVGAETTGISFTVGAGVSRQLSQLNVSCFRMALIKVKRGATTILTGRTGPGSYNLALPFSQVDPILTGESITVTFEGFERASDIELFLSGTES